MENTCLSLPHHLPYRRVRDQFTPAHVLQGRFHRRCLVAFPLLPGGAKNVPRRKMANPKAMEQEFGLRALAYPRRAEKHKSPRTSVRSWYRALGGWPLQPGGAVVRNGCLHAIQGTRSQEGIL